MAQLYLTQITLLDLFFHRILYHLNVDSKNVLFHPGLHFTSCVTQSVVCLIRFLVSLALVRLHHL